MNESFSRFGRDIQHNQGFWTNNNCFALLFWIEITRGSNIHYLTIPGRWSTGWLIRTPFLIWKIERFSYLFLMMPGRLSNGRLRWTPFLNRRIDPFDDTRSLSEPSLICTLFLSWRIEISAISFQYQEEVWVLHARYALLSWIKRIERFQRFLLFLEIGSRIPKRLFSI